VSDKLDSILGKVRGLVAKAEHPDTPPHEADTARQLADAMMLKYAVDAAMLRDSQPVNERQKPGKAKVDLVEAASLYENNFIMLIAVVTEHTRTKSVITGAGIPADVAEAVNQYRRNKGEGPKMVQAYVYGFESDLKYFEILYTTLLLHMSNGIDPKPDASLSDELNSYNLRAAGLNWGEIARIFYGRRHKYGWDGDQSNYMRFTGYWKRAAMRETRRRGEEAIHIPAKVTDEARKIWRLNFARSYVATLQRRLWNARNARTTGSEIVLKSSMDEINRMINAEHKNLTNMESLDQDVPFNKAAWNAGNRHADAADIGGTGVAARVAGALR
jgi:hypothetical protein